MAQIDDEERCIALTQSGDRCSRIAKDGQFCFQHDESAPTIDDAEADTGGLVTVVADQVQVQAERFTGAQRDMARNIEDILTQSGTIAQSVASLNFSEALEEVGETLDTTTPTPAKYAVYGGAGGSLFGPLGTAGGATAGAWYGVFKVVDDDRAVSATVVEDVPEDATVVDSSHKAIADLEPVQLALQSAQENGDRTEWLSSTLLRERDMDEVEAALQELPAYQEEEGTTQYYIRDIDTGAELLLVFGVPADEQRD